MKKPTQQDITNKLLLANFPQGPEMEQASDPVADTPMLVTLEQLRPYEHNPRFIRNPLYDDLKASIRERGLDQPPPITRRPGEQHFIIRNGGNSRLAILGELWQETREERFFASTACSGRGPTRPPPCSAIWPKATCTASSPSSSVPWQSPSSRRCLKPTAPRCHNVSWPDA